MIRKAIVGNALTALLSVVFLCMSAIRWCKRRKDIKNSFLTSCMISLGKMNIFFDKCWMNGYIHNVNFSIKDNYK
jgi:hypothetical protein